jgi:preprotein translocase subunit SecG
MGIVSIILLVLFVIAAILLVAIVLIQDEGGEGLGGIFGGGSSAPVGNRSGNILTRTTTVLGALFLVIAFSLAWLNRTPDAGDVEAAARRLEGQEGVIEWWRTDEEIEPPETIEAPEPEGSMEATDGDATDEDGNDGEP